MNKLLDETGWRGWLLPGVVLLGAALRLQLFFIGRGLWLDEAMMSVGIIRQPLPMITAPLDYIQQAPLGYVLMVKLSTVLFGDGPMALRVPSILAGLSTLILIVYVARRLDLLYGARLLLIGLVSFNPYLINYSNEVKQYAVDAFFATALLAVFVSNGRRRHALLLGLITIGLFFSHPLVFVAAAFLVAELFRSSNPNWRKIIVPGVLLAVFFSLHYLLFVRQSIDTYHAHWYTMNYHRDFFMPLTFWKFETWMWFPRYASRFMTHLMYFHLPIIGSLLLAFGAVHAVRRPEYRGLAILIVFSVAFAAIASSLQLYTLKTPRMMLYAMPLMAVLFGLGYHAVQRIENARMFVQSLAVIVLSVGLLVPLGVRAWRMTDFRSYGYREEVREIFPIWNRELRAGEGTYVHYRVEPIVHYNCLLVGRPRRYAISNYIPDEHLADSICSRVGNRGWAFFSDTDLAYLRIKDTLDALYHIRYTWSHDSSAVLLRLHARE